VEYIIIIEYIISNKFEIIIIKIIFSIFSFNIKWLLTDTNVYPILLQDHLVRRRQENSKGQKQHKVKKLKLEINDKENNQERNSLVNDKGYLCDCISQCLLIDIIVILFYCRII
jgi:hypothetical protein